MTEFGRVHDGVEYELPVGWKRAPDAVLELAMQRAQAAVLAEVATADRDLQDPGPLETYFDPGSNYAGALFNSIDPDAAASPAVTISDLLAVSTLNINLEALQLRRLLTEGPKQTAVNEALAAVPRNVALSELNTGRHDTAQLLVPARTLHDELLRTPKPSSNRWVFAAKMCARKRPKLMPVRDTVVCKFLADSAQRRSDESMGNFVVDLQVFAFLLSNEVLTDNVTMLQKRLQERYGPQMNEVPTLRVLDVVLWSAGIAAGYGRR